MNNAELALPQKHSSIGGGGVPSPCNDTAILDLQPKTVESLQQHEQQQPQQPAFMHDLQRHSADFLGMTWAID